MQSSGHLEFAGGRGVGAGGAVLDLSAFPDLLPGTGTEMHRRVLATDWATTPLGPLERWSPTLRTAVGICLSSRVPMLLMLGGELVMVYNDAYAEVLGPRHPGALGRTVPDVWSEIWPVLEPMVRGTLAGRSTFDEDLPFLMTR
ncbi:MAG: hypothetical protein ACLGI3_12225, partial [Actinomycetes bacterium]